MKGTYVKQPCTQANGLPMCPFRKATLKGWLGEGRAKEIAQSKSFHCHKTTEGPSPMQCAGHMLVCSRNLMARVAKATGTPLGIKGQEEVFDTEQDFINHHK